MANGRIIGPVNIPASGIAGGIWSLTEQLAAIKAGSWNLPPELLEIKSYGHDEISSGTNSIIVQRPTPTEIGDLLILVVYTTDSRDISEATVGGNDWTVVDEDFGVTNNNVYKALYTLTVANARTNWEFDLAGATTQPGYVIVNVGPYGEIDNSGTSFARAGLSNNTQTVPSVDFSNATNLDLIIVGGRSFVDVAPSGFTTLVNTTDGRPDSYFGYRENVTPVSTGTTTMSFNDKDNGLYRIIVSDTRVPVVEYVGLYTSTSALTSYSFTTANLDLGLIVVVVHSEDTVEDSPASSVTIGGNSATQAIGVTGSNVNSWSSTSIWYHELSSPTNNVTVTFGAAPGRAAIAIYRILNYSSTTPYFTGSDITASVTTRSVTTSVLTSNSVIIAAQTNGDGSGLRTTWSDITEQYDTFWGTSTGATGASLGGSNNTSYTITSTNSATTTQGNSLAVAVWR